MTKDEAIKVAIEAKANWGSGSSESWLVNALESLGLIKFDEPLESRQSPTFKAYDALFEHIPTLDFLTFRKLLREASLEVVAQSPQVGAVPHD